MPENRQHIYKDGAYFNIRPIFYDKILITTGTEVFKTFGNFIPIDNFP